MIEKTIRILLFPILAFLLLSLFLFDSNASLIVSASLWCFCCCYLEHKGHERTKDRIENMKLIDT